MFNIFKKLRNEFNNKIDEVKNKQTIFAASLEVLQHSVARVDDLLKQHEVLSTKLKETIEHLNSDSYTKHKKEKEQKENAPYFEILSIDYDDAQGIKIRTDWNDEMIKYLRKYPAYNHGGEDDIIQRYIFNTISEQIKNKGHKIDEFG